MSVKSIERSIFQRVAPVCLSRAMTYCTSMPSMGKINRSRKSMGDEPGPR